MKILITNDDGIDAPGIKALAKAFKNKHNIIVVAPDTERSAASHGVVSMRGISYKLEKQYDYLAYSATGLPADCVKLAVLHILDNKKPDLILSGINMGTNLSTDVIYSGTVSAAFEGIYMGIPSIAISASYKTTENKFDEAAQFVLQNLEKMLKLNLPITSALNINYPTHTEKVLGVKIAPLGRHLYDGGFTKHNDGYILGGNPLPPEKQDKDTDAYWFYKGYVSLTPVQNDRNDYATLKRLGEEF